MKMTSLSVTPPQSSTPKSKPKSSLYVGRVTPSPSSPAPSTGSQSSHEEGRVNGGANGVAAENGGSLENSCSSQETHDARLNGGREKERGGGEESEIGKDAEGGGGEGGVKELPKIMTISASPKMTSSATNHQQRHLGHTRASSASSFGSPSSIEQGSSSSSSLLSHDSSFASREALIEQLQLQLKPMSSDPNLAGSAETRGQSSLGGVRDPNEVITQLLEHIVTLKMDLETLKEENQKLKSTRSEMDDELHTLTENLFEEAYKMVDEAKGNKVVAEKRLADAAGKIEAMETEMFALKSLIHNPEGASSSLSDGSVDKLHPSVDKLHPSPHHKHHHKRPSMKKALRKLAKKASGSKVESSSHKLSTKQLPPPGQVVPITLVEHKGGVVRGGTLKVGELLPSDFGEFKEWLGALSTEPDHAYLDRIIKTDLIPCLTFRDHKLSSQVLEAVKDNNLLVESITNCERGTCALSGDEVTCTHRLKFGDSDQWLHISQPCRDRIVAACDFYMCIGHIQKGIVKSDPMELYWRVSRLRAMMSLSRLNLYLPEEN